jgi:hypothetical protein
MVDGIGCSNRLPTRGILLSGVEVSIETGKIAAADLESYPMSLAKDIAG